MRQTRRLVAPWLALALLAAARPGAAAGGGYPGRAWKPVASPGKLGWSKEKLQRAQEFSKTIPTAGKHLPGVSLPDGSYSARGAGGHYILVVPTLDLVLVHRVDTDQPGRGVTPQQFGELVRLVLEAKR